VLVLAIAYRTDDEVDVPDPASRFSPDGIADTDIRAGRLRGATALTALSPRKSRNRSGGRHSTHFLSNRRACVPQPPMRTSSLPSPFRSPTAMLQLRPMVLAGMNSSVTSLKFPSPSLA
jgi:hypothetical protein